MFTTIHEIIFHGNGGYDYTTVYNMPIWLRNFTYQKLHEHYSKESKQVEQATKTNSPTNTSQKNIINPDYISKVSKK